MLDQGTSRISHINISAMSTDRNTGLTSGFKIARSNFITFFKVKDGFYVLKLIFLMILTFYNFFYMQQTVCFVLLIF